MTVKDEALRKAVVRAIAAAPCSQRQLALAAGVSPALLTYIRQGKKHPSVATARALMQALEVWSDDCATAAAILSRQLTKGARTR